MIGNQSLPGLESPGFDGMFIQDERPVQASHVSKFDGIAVVRNSSPITPFIVAPQRTGLAHTLTGIRQALAVLLFHQLSSQFTLHIAIPQN